MASKNSFPLPHLAIQSLPDSLRTVTALYHIGGISRREIADYLGLSETAVKKRLFDSRHKLKEEITRMVTAYQLDPRHILRTQTSGATLRAVKGRQPPIRLLTAGRVFRRVEEDEQHLKVFHQVDGICVAPDASPDKLLETLKALFSTVLGRTEIRFRDCDWGWVDHGSEIDARSNDKWVSIAGCGMLKPDMLREAGHDPRQVQGFAFGLGLVRLAVLKFGLRSVDELWRPRYVQPRL